MKFIMNKRTKIPKSLYNSIVEQYTQKYVSMSEIAVKYGVSRMAIWKILRRCGVDTRKSVSGNIPTNCLWCGENITVKRYIYRKRKNNYCNEHCFHKWLKRNK